MSVLIKGMNMPRSCANCEWSSLSKMDLGMSIYCKLAKKTGNLEVAKNFRVEFCPLVEVPTPHGRLIDADAMKKLWEGCIIEGSIDVFLDVRPTVIEAEVEE